jgi:capsule polysaccharide export protein KpsE/RkpR
MENEPKDIVLVKLDKVLAEMQAFRSETHADMMQLKARQSAVEKELALLRSTVSSIGESVAAQWEHYDKHDERLRQLEHPE